VYINLLPQIVTCGIVHRPAPTRPPLRYLARLWKDPKQPECSKQFKHPHKLFAALFLCYAPVNSARLNRGNIRFLPTDPSHNLCCKAICRAYSNRRNDASASEAKICWFGNPVLAIQHPMHFFKCNKTVCRRIDPLSTAVSFGFV
jgi:hypothetical protein